MVDVARANQWARADNGNTVSYDFPSHALNDNLKVQLDGGINTVSAGEGVKLIGKPPAHGYTESSSPKFRMPIIHPAAP